MDGDLSPASVAERAQHLLRQRPAEVGQVPHPEGAERAHAVNDFPHGAFDDDLGRRVVGPYGLDGVVGPRRAGQGLGSWRFGTPHGGASPPQPLPQVVELGGPQRATVDRAPRIAQHFVANVLGRRRQLRPLRPLEMDPGSRKNLPDVRLPSLHPFTEQARVAPRDAIVLFVLGGRPLPPASHVRLQRREDGPVLSSSDLRQDRVPQQGGQRLGHRGRRDGQGSRPGVGRRIPYVAAGDAAGRSQLRGLQKPSQRTVAKPRFGRAELLADPAGQGRQRDRNATCLHVLSGGFDDLGFVQPVGSRRLPVRSLGLLSGAGEVVDQVEALVGNVRICMGRVARRDDHRPASVRSQVLQQRREVRVVGRDDELVVRRTRGFGVESGEHVHDHADVGGVLHSGGERRAVHDLEPGEQEGLAEPRNGEPFAGAVLVPHPSLGVDVRAPHQNFPLGDPGRQLRARQVSQPLGEVPRQCVGNVRPAAVHAVENVVEVNEEG